MRLSTGHGPMLASVNNVQPPRVRLAVRQGVEGARIQPTQHLMTRHGLSKGSVFHHLIEQAGQPLNP